MDIYRSARQAHTLTQQLTGTIPTPVNLKHATNGMVLFNGSTLGSGTLGYNVHLYRPDGTTFTAQFITRPGENIFLPVSIVGSESSGNATFPIGVVGLY